MGLESMVQWEAWRQTVKSVELVTESLSYVMHASSGHQEDARQYDMGGVMTIHPGATVTWMLHTVDLHGSSPRENNSNIAMLRMIALTHPVWASLSQQAFPPPPCEW
jgi:hypothetical protein